MIQILADNKIYNISNHYLDYMELHFRLHNTGNELIIEAYPANNNTVDGILRKSWNLDSIGLESEIVPDKMNLPHGEHKIPSRKSLVRGGFRIEIQHNRDLVIVYPKNRNRNILESKKIIYRFNDIGVKSLENDGRDRKLNATLDPLPVDKDNKFEELS